MAGIFDEVMDGIAAKEGEKTAEPAAQQTPDPVNDKAMHKYDESFTKKYGERKIA